MMGDRMFRVRLIAAVAVLLWWIVPDVQGWHLLGWSGGGAAVWLLPRLWRDRGNWCARLLLAAIVPVMIWDVWPWLILGMSWGSLRWSEGVPVIRRRCVGMMVLGVVFGLSCRPALAFCLKISPPYLIWSLLPVAVLAAAAGYFVLREHIGFWVLSPVGRLGAMGGLYFAGVAMCRSYACGDPAAPWMIALPVAAGLLVMAQLVHGVVYIHPAIRRGAAVGEGIAAAVLIFSLLTAGWFLPYKRGFVADNEAVARDRMDMLEPLIDGMVSRYRAEHGRWPEARSWRAEERALPKKCFIDGSRLHGDRLMLYCRIPLRRLSAVVIRCYDPDGTACWDAVGRSNPLIRLLPPAPLPAAVGREKQEK